MNGAVPVHQNVMGRSSIQNPLAPDNTLHVNATVYEENTNVGENLQSQRATSLEKEPETDTTNNIIARSSCSEGQLAQPYETAPAINNWHKIRGAAPMHPSSHPPFQLQQLGVRMRTSINRVTVYLNKMLN